MRLKTSGECTTLTCGGMVSLQLWETRPLLSPFWWSRSPIPTHFDFYLWSARMASTPVNKAAEFYTSKRSLTAWPFTRGQAGRERRYFPHIGASRESWSDVARRGGEGVGASLPFAAASFDGVFFCWEPLFADFVTLSLSGGDTLAGSPLMPSCSARWIWDIRIS